MSAADLMAKTVRKLRSEGGRELAKRVVRRVYHRLDAGSLDFPLFQEDITDSSSLLPAAPPPRPRADGPLTIGWLATPPGAGSGGHTTMFRMIQALEQAGHTCVLFLYDRHHGDLAQHAAVIARSWPWVRAEIRDATLGFADIDACVATSWPSAHVLATRGADLHRFYFIQDYEPFFFPRGSEYELAADTYRFGFTNIALGPMIQNRLRDELGVSSRLVPFSCDSTIYTVKNLGPRSGVVFYSKPDVARRGYLLAPLALEEFHRRHPDQPIHVYGDPMPDVPFPTIRHDRLTPEALNDLYNSTIAGLAMSFTNITLVAEEMLAAGNIPVVPDSGDSRAGLPNDHVAWSAPTPTALADALCHVVERTDAVARSAAAAASVRTDNWEATGREVVRIIEDTVYVTERSQISAEGAPLSSPAPAAGIWARAKP